MNHFTVLTDQLERTVSFYVGVLGLESGPRPDFAFPGAWLYAAGQPILHVVAGRPMPSEPAGVLDHIAFSASDLEGIKSRLEALQIPYQLRRVAGAGIWQLFCHDPNGARVELDFDAEPDPPG
jgi:catechol 2,3-dioxygenase-like lactoylglutathione lyase family enzyme